MLHAYVKSSKFQVIWFGMTEDWRYDLPYCRWGEYTGHYY